MSRYFQCLHPQWAILDPDLHTLDHVRTRSALLTTTILALASTILSVLLKGNDDQVTEALRLHAHVEKLTLVVFATAAKSVEIVQAQIVRVCCFQPDQVLMSEAFISMGCSVQDTHR
jgi:hypothetical protein